MPTIDFTNLSGAVARSFPRAPALSKSNWAFYKGDHWQYGDGWSGPRPGSGEVGADRAMQLLRKGFVSRNATKEVVRRHKNGVIDAEPVWNYTPITRKKPDDELTDAEKSTQQELVDAMTLVWDRRNLHKAFKKLVKYVLLSESAMFRLYIPPQFQRTERTTTGATRTVVAASTFEEALDMIHVDVVLPQDGAVVMDDVTKLSLGVFIESERSVEMTFLETGVDLPSGAAPRTILRRVASTNNGAQDEEVALELGGRLTMHEVRREPFITEQLHEMQKALNLAHSALPRNIITSGWLRVTLLNAQMPGSYVKPTGGGPEKFVPTGFHTGPGSTQFVAGIKFRTEKGEEITNPQIHEGQPTPVAPTVDAKQNIYHDILDETDQTHVIIAGESAPSGKSREEARDGFRASLQDTASEVNVAGRWLMETYVALAEWLSGQPGKYTSVMRGEFECRLNVGPLTTAEQQNVHSSVEKKLMAPETGMSRLGILDTDAERRRIQGDPLSKVKLFTEQMAALAAAQRVGADLMGAAQEIGLPPEVVKLLKLDQPTLPEDRAPTLPGTAGNTRSPQPTGVQRPAPGQRPPARVAGASRGAARAS